MRAARVDGNHGEIVRALRKIGATAKSTATIGQGFPDLVVGYRGINVLLEVKDGDKPPSARRLTAAEQEFVDTWAGAVFTVTSPEHAVLVVVEAARK